MNIMLSQFALPTPAQIHPFITVSTENTTVHRSIVTETS